MIDNSRFFLLLHSQRCPICPKLLLAPYLNHAAHVATKMHHNMRKFKEMMNRGKRVFNSDLSSIEHFCSLLSMDIMYIMYKNITNAEIIFFVQVLILHPWEYVVFILLEWVLLEMLFSAQHC